MQEALCIQRLNRHGGSKEGAPIAAVLTLTLRKDLQSWLCSHKPCGRTSNHSWVNINPVEGAPITAVLT
uniref:Uncharacterized protein n=1 Tax=Anguilla anguilla TaxID=7936 RepID=A0A0E9S795_ANGAN